MKPSQAALPNMADPHAKVAPRRPGSSPAGRPPLDLVHLTRQTFGDKRLETELLRLFLRQSDQIQKSLEAMGEDAAVSTVELLHMLSGSARVIGATEVAARAGRLEAEIRAGLRADLDLAERRDLGETIGRTGRYISDLLDQG